MNIVLESTPSPFGLVHVALIASLLLAFTGPLIIHRVRGGREWIMPLWIGAMFACIVGMFWAIGYSAVTQNATEEAVTQKFEQSQSVTHLFLDDEYVWTDFSCSSSEERHTEPATWVDANGQYQVGVLAMDAKDGFCHYELLATGEK